MRVFITCSVLLAASCTCGAADEQWTLSPTSLSFGAPAPGARVQRTITLDNPTRAAVSLTLVVDDPRFEVPASVTVAPGSTQTVTVDFGATSRDAIRATLVAQDSKGVSARTQLAVNASTTQQGDAGGDAGMNGPAFDAGGNEEPFDAGSVDGGCLNALWGARRFGTGSGLVTLNTYLDGFVVRRATELFTVAANGTTQTRAGLGTASAVAAHDGVLGFVEGDFQMPATFEDSNGASVTLATPTDNIPLVVWVQDRNQWLVINHGVAHWLTTKVEAVRQVPTRAGRTIVVDGQTAIYPAFDQDGGLDLAFITPTSTRTTHIGDTVFGHYATVATRDGGLAITWGQGTSTMLTLTDPTGTPVSSQVVGRSGLPASLAWSGSQWLVLAPRAWGFELVSFDVMGAEVARLGSICTSAQFPMLMANDGHLMVVTENILEGPGVRATVLRSP
ncbi:MAG: hypothetical protein Q8L14_34365 [Myxococcales bacterium]|nr:hypothetical protein [Myxococcales bacterium]